MCFHIKNSAKRYSTIVYLYKRLQ